MRWMILFAAALAALAAACGDDDENGGGDLTNTPTTTQTAPPGETASPGTVVDCSPNLEQPAADGDLTWEAILPEPVPAPEGWTVEKDEGEGPFLVVRRGAEAVGSIELGQFPLEAEFDPQLGFNALEAWAQRFFASVQADRELTSGEGYAFEADEPTPIPFGQFCGVRYSFTGTQDGDVVERFAGYATFDESKLYIVTATYDAGLAGEMGFVDAESMEEYEPSFGDLVAALRVPAE